MIQCNSQKCHTIAGNHKEQSVWLLKRMKVSTLQLFKNLQREGLDNTSALITNTITLFTVKIILVFKHL